MSLDRVSADDASTHLGGSPTSGICLHLTKTSLAFLRDKVLCVLFILLYMQLAFMKKLRLSALSQPPYLSQNLLLMVSDHPVILSLTLHTMTIPLYFNIFPHNSRFLITLGIVCSFANEQRVYDRLVRRVAKEIIEEYIAGAR